MNSSSQTKNGRLFFAELKPPLTRDEALLEANRCLYCYDAPCIRQCPTHIDIPRFIKKIATNNMVGAARTIFEANMLGASCARVCPTTQLCEGACVLNKLHEKPIAIGRLQRYATDPFVLEEQQIFEPAPSNGRKVAIIGAGPAGLSCAAELVKLGYEAQIFEAEEKGGGLNTYGIADYKMDQATSLQEVQWLEEFGVKIRYNTRVGQDIPFQQLFDEYDAIFLGVGLGKIPKLGLPGENLEGSRDVLDFIRDLKSLPKEKMSLKGKKVAVLGGGNSAIDGVIQAKYLGAERVYLVYRRGEKEIPAYAHERDHAKLKGVEFVYMASPQAIEGEESVKRLVCLRTKLGEPDESGRRRPEIIEGSEFSLDVDFVFRATGQEKRRSFLEAIPQLQLDEKGRVIVDENGRTTHPKIWSGGDCVNGGKEVVNAVADGKRAALHIHQTLEQ